MPDIFDEPFTIDDLKGLLMEDFYLVGGSSLPLVKDVKINTFSVNRIPPDAVVAELIGENGEVVSPYKFRDVQRIMRDYLKNCEATGVGPVVDDGCSVFDL
jgi:hypothetical protein